MRRGFFESQHSRRTLSRAALAARLSPGQDVDKWPTDNWSFEDPLSWSAEQIIERLEQGKVPPCSLIETQSGDLWMVSTPRTKRVGGTTVDFLKSREHFSIEEKHYPLIKKLVRIDSGGGCYND